MVLLHLDPPLQVALPKLEPGAHKARNMLRRSLQAFVGRDAETARHIGAEDDGVDGRHDWSAAHCRRSRSPSHGPRMEPPGCSPVAHNLERSADRGTNICERVVYQATGRMEQMNVSTY